jgi:hypothetical protein
MTPAVLAEGVRKRMRQALSEWRLRPVVEALMRLRGIDFIRAITLVAGNTHARQLVTTLKRKASELLADIKREGVPILSRNTACPAAYLVDLNAYDARRSRTLAS